MARMATTLGSCDCVHYAKFFAPENLRKLCCMTAEGMQSSPKESVSKAIDKTVKNIEIRNKAEYEIAKIPEFTKIIRNFDANFVGCGVRPTIKDFLAQYKKIPLDRKIAIRAELSNAAEKIYRESNL